MRVGIFHGCSGGARPGRGVRRPSRQKPHFGGTIRFRPDYRQRRAAQCKCQAADFNKGMFRLLDCAVQCEFCAAPLLPNPASTAPNPHSRHTSARVTNILHIQSDLAAAPAGGAHSRSLTSTTRRAAGRRGRPLATGTGKRPRPALNLRALLLHSYPRISERNSHWKGDTKSAELGGGTSSSRPRGSS